MSTPLNCSTCGGRQKDLQQAKCLYCGSPLASSAPALSQLPSPAKSTPPTADPVQRLLALCQAISPLRHWSNNWPVLYSAAASLVRVPGSPADLAARLFKAADQIKGRAKWTSVLRQDMRLGFAAALLRQGRDVDTLHLALEQGSRMFRQVGLRRHGPREAMACLLLMEAPGDGLPSKAQIEELALIDAGMKEHHRYVTRWNQYPVAALLISKGEPAKDVTAGLERIYQGLRQRAFRGGTQLQVAASLLYLAEGSDDARVERFHALYSTFKEEGLRMHPGDYDEVATLAILELDPSTVVEQVLADRAVLRRELSPRPTKQVGFDLAAHTALLLLSSGSTRRGLEESALQLNQALALLQIQQASAAAAAQAAGIY